MESLRQTTSSQTKPFDASNNNYNNGAERLKSPKPPLLPKPKIINLKPVKKNQVLPEILTENEGSSNFNDKEATEKNSGSTSQQDVSENEQVSPKIKPQLPPKSFSCKASKSDSHLGRLSLLQNPELVPNKSALIDKTLFRNPESPQKNIMRSPLNNYTVKNALLETAGLSKDILLSKQKSASLCRNEDLNWKIREFVKDSDQLSEFCKEVEKCSKHSHILKTSEDSPVTTQRGKKKLQDELDLASDNHDTKNDKIKELDIIDKAGNQHKGDDINKTSKHINGYEGNTPKSPIFQHENISKGDQNLSLELPKSFLHRYVSSCIQTKETENGNETEKNSSEDNSEKFLNVQSFLHKNREPPTPKLRSSRSLEKQSSPSDVSWNSPNGNTVSSSVTNSDQLLGINDTEKSDNFSPPLPVSGDVTPSVKRFPWFGSFGKGNKKDSLKKGRCFSQFYSSPNDMEGKLLYEKNRTKSLPDIKHTRAASDGTLQNSATDNENSNMLQISAYQQSDSEDDKDSLNQVESGFEKDSKTLAYLKAKELMTSEEVFIDVLKLLNVDFRNYVQLRSFEGKNSYVPNSELNKILNHLSQLQSLNEDILEDLRKRIENWETNPKIADVIVKKGAFLKMYTTYIQNFESQTNYLDECIAKYPKFGKIVKEFELSPRCKKLSLKHYMLKPVQRIPQYRLLLNDYLKYLDESSADYLDTQNALKIVCEVVDHANRNVSHGDKEGRLMHFQSLLSDFELVKPGRQLIKDGPLEKICRKTVKDRYFILLNDCLLHTTYSKQYLKIHQELPLSGMKICFNNDKKDPPSFTVYSITKSFILCAKSEAECEEWVETLQKTIEEYIRRQQTFLNVKIETDSRFKLGKEAPVWVQDSKVTMCQICTAEFTALFRRHHCRGCGKVVCRNCGSNQAPLQYRNFKPDRVCDQCFDLLLKDYEDSEDSICEILKEMLNLSDDSVQNEYLSIKTKFWRYNSAKKQKYIPPRLKEVSANDSQSVINGWLYRKSRKSWKLFWYVLKDHVLYVYKASEDVLALDTIPVLGYEVERSNVVYEDVDKKLVFSLVHPHQTPITFRAESQESADRWFEALSAATNFNYLAI